MENDDSVNSSTWKLGGYKFSKEVAVYFAQIIILYILIITSLCNLTFQNDNRELWVAIISSSTGYLLPQPSIKKKKGSNIISSNNRDIAN